MEKQLKEISWQAPEFKYEHKDISWYWLSIIVTGLIILLAIWQKNPLFALFIAIAEIMIIFWAKEFPKTLNFKIDDKGVHIDKIKTYDYDDLKGFHIIEKENISELVLKTKNRLHPIIKIIIAKTNIVEIKDILNDHLPEIEYEESLTDHIDRLLKF
ncbi:MAG: hypothetical protein AAB674_03385 [Patescibacteria group bacterium]